jgi:hypothetical protein
MPAVTVAVGFLCFTTGCKAPTKPSSPPQLTPYTAPDQSASVGVPPGWQVTSGQQTAITMTGPGNVMVSLGFTVVAKNAAFQLGQRGSNGVDLTMPYSAPLAQKLAMILEQGAALSGQSLSEFQVASSTPLSCRQHWVSAVDS